MATESKAKQNFHVGMPLDVAETLKEVRATLEARRGVKHTYGHVIGEALHHFRQRLAVERLAASASVVSDQPDACCCGIHLGQGFQCAGKNAPHNDLCEPCDTAGCTYRQRHCE